MTTAVDWDVKHQTNKNKYVINPVLSKLHLALVYYKCIFVMSNQRAYRPDFSFVVTNLGDNCIQNFHLGRYIVGYTVGNFSFTATRERSRKT